MTPIFRSSSCPLISQDTAPPKRLREDVEEATATIVESSSKPNKSAKLVKTNYRCTPILDLNNRIESIRFNATKELLDQRRREFPDITHLSAQILTLDFNKLVAGPFNVPSSPCKLYYLSEQRVVLIKAPNKFSAECERVRPLQEMEGTQHRLRPILGIKDDGTFLDLIQLSSKIHSKGKIDPSTIQKMIDFEVKFYTGLPSNHDTIPIPITLCLLSSGIEENPNQKMKIIQKRESLDLLEAINKKTNFPRASLLTIARDLSQAVDYCHDLGIVVADIKTENILIDLKTLKARLTDFGMSFPVTEATTENLLRGTNLTYAPEVVGDFYTNNASLASITDRQRVFPQDSKRIFARDIWSLGHVLFHLFFSKVPNCSYILNAMHEHDDQSFYKKLFIKILTNKASVDEFISFMERYNQAPLTEEQKCNILKSNPADEAILKKVFPILEKMLNFDPMKRPNAKSLIAEFNALIDQLPAYNPPQ
jgi:hypothetical protein